MLKFWHMLHHIEIEVLVNTVDMSLKHQLDAVAFPLVLFLVENIQ